jgi:hypothetical protein
VVKVVHQRLRKKACLFWGWREYKLKEMIFLEEQKRDEGEEE